MVHYFYLVYLHVNKQLSITHSKDTSNRLVREKWEETKARHESVYKANGKTLGMSSVRVFSHQSLRVHPASSSSDAAPCLVSPKVGRTPHGQSS